MVNTYILMRHGEAASNVRGTLSSFPEPARNSLTKEGKKHAGEQAKKMKRRQINLIISSPLLRARQTARIVSAALGISVHYDKRLREINFGELNGAPEKKYDRFSRAPSFALRPKGGESLADVEKRTERFARSVTRRYSGKHILVVGHGAPLRILARVLANWKSAKFSRAKRLDLKTGEFARVAV